MTDPVPAEGDASKAAPEPIYLDLDIPRRVPEPVQAPAVAPGTPPLPVLIAPEQEPIPVVLAGTPEPAGMTTTTTTTIPAPNIVTKGEGATLSPTTTEQQDIVTEGQRRINLIWETTQSRIALLVVVAGVAVNSLVILLIVFLNKEVSVTQLALISISLQFINLTAGIVIGFYFSRINHNATGGVGAKPAEAPYTGR